jgi:hypothetical protein
MASTESRAFIIGDEELGLTIVLTDPVMVVHYSPGDLKDSGINELLRDDPGMTSKKTQVAVARELTLLFRGVNLDTAYDPDQKIYDEQELEGELDYGRAIGRILFNGGSIHDVDFCIAMKVDTTSIGLQARVRSVDPARTILEYIGEADPAKRPTEFVIGKVPVDRLDPMPPLKPL